ncbi:type II toxin-antitoxin system RelE/ParE family toxin [Solitalea sp. MAHUQ-68]|uniref:Type II toxin-antitoxin system RelE/ParE family toxin n=1 Tax=Solitalea agri TaxID=2953739 RepID=A0A9X2EYL3_9SPHI|nr:type II toxin-antitoxin system RelE/ParE family toxin [Solitalea agri]MCO4291377.1 type II toxin-antitoxin system RelE/ParE family toxin [Solitalea agri]
MQVFLTARAERNFYSIVTYLKNKWGEKTANEFIQKTDQVFKLLKSFPSIGQIEQEDIRGFQLSPQTRILYRVGKNKIIVLTFFDVRQHPGKKFS